MSKNRLDRTIVRGYVGFSYFLCFPATVPPFADPLALSTRFKAQREQGRVGRRGDGGWGMRDGGWGGKREKEKRRGTKWELAHLFQVAAIYGEEKVQRT